MARVAIFPHADVGHLFCIVRAAHDLMARGHQVVFFAPDYFGPMLRERSLEQVAAYDKSWDAEALARVHRGTIDDRRAVELKMREEVTESVLSGAWANLLEAYGIDCILADVFVPVAAMLAWSEQIPCIQYAGTVFPHFFRSDAPADARESLERRTNQYKEQQPALRAINARPEKVASHLNYPPGASGYPWPWQCATATQACLFPDSFMKVTGYECLNLESVAREQLSSEVPPCSESSTIYFSLGTAQAMQWSEEVTEAITQGVQAALDKSSKQWTLVSGRPRVADPQKGYRQAEILAEGARLAIFHGGVGTLKDCVASGVPSLIIPAMLDHLAGEILAEERGVARRCEAPHTAVRVEQAVTAALEDTSAFERIPVVREQLRRFELGWRWVDTVERLVQS
jgi:UDP:flavonoid glycosyltransferase YjiC (YdhE family)